jgi:hypothetical protein
MVLQTSPVPAARGFLLQQRKTVELETVPMDDHIIVSRGPGKESKP